MKIWWMALMSDRRRRQRVKKLAHAERSSRIRLQVREFNGAMYICFDDYPIVSEDTVIGSMPDALAESRDKFVEYLMRNEEYRM